jgi:hypothetical protein
VERLIRQILLLGVLPGVVVGNICEVSRLLLCLLRLKMFNKSGIESESESKILEATIR